MEFAIRQDGWNGYSGSQAPQPVAAPLHLRSNNVASDSSFTSSNWQYVTPFEQSYVPSHLPLLNSFGGGGGGGGGLQVQSGGRHEQASAHPASASHYSRYDTRDIAPSSMPATQRPPPHARALRQPLGSAARDELHAIGLTRFTEHEQYMPNAVQPRPSTSANETVVVGHYGYQYDMAAIAQSGLPLDTQTSQQTPSMSPPRPSTTQYFGHENTLQPSHAPTLTAQYNPPTLSQPYYGATAVQHPRMASDADRRHALLASVPALTIPAHGQSGIEMTMQTISYHPQPGSAAHEFNLDSGMAPADAMAQDSGLFAPTHDQSDSPQDVTSTLTQTTMSPSHRSAGNHLEDSEGYTSQHTAAAVMSPFSASSFASPYSAGILASPISAVSHPSGIFTAATEEAGQNGEAASGPSKRPRSMHPCPHCHKSFDRPSTLRVHRRVHTLEKNYVCEKCDRRFSVESNLKRHVKGCGLAKDRNPRKRERSTSEDGTVSGDEAEEVIPQELPKAKRPRRKNIAPPWRPASLEGFTIGTNARLTVPLPLSIAEDVAEGRIDQVTAALQLRITQQNMHPRPYSLEGWNGSFPGPGLKPITYQMEAY
ncbi:hypothetical protein BKA62DRAFT_768988 [Auriculariales sp. MPI-PUGE-AT-0066]|nr:hypothetical protein BKA62DRAFT_768988 [Auriculariales sp. MPI-PUGE-AT-0066]